MELMKLTQFYFEIRNFDWHKKLFFTQLKSVKLKKSYTTQLFLKTTKQSHQQAKYYSEQLSREIK